MRYLAVGYFFLAAFLVGAFFLEGAEFFFADTRFKGLTALTGLFADTLLNAMALAGAANGLFASAAFFAGVFSVETAVLAAGGADNCAPGAAGAGGPATGGALGLRPRLAGTAG